MAKRRKVKIVPPVWWTNGYDYATAERGEQVPAILKQESLTVVILGESESVKDAVSRMKKRRGKHYGARMRAIFLRSMYRD